jgi:hypothetical protein
MRVALTALALVALASRVAGESAFWAGRTVDASILRLTQADFADAALAVGRSAHLFVLFNTRNPRHSCESCPCVPVRGPRPPHPASAPTPACAPPCAASPAHPAAAFPPVRVASRTYDDEFETAASSYWIKRSASGDAAGAPAVAAFARVEHGDGAALFGQLDLRQVPVLAYFPPTPGAALLAEPLAPGARYDGDATAEAMARWIGDRAGMSFDVRRSPWGGLVMLLVLLGGGGWVAFAYGQVLLRVAEFARSQRWLWLAVSVGFFFVAVSGFLYDIIRGVPWIGWDSNTRRPQYVYPGSGFQYGIEGAMVGVLNLLCAGAVVALVRFVPRAKVADPTSRSVMAAAAIFVFAFMYAQIVNLYILKNRWYLNALFG